MRDCFSKVERTIADGPELHAVAAIDPAPGRELVVRYDVGVAADPVTNTKFTWMPLARPGCFS
jgi:hypothetical protein